MRYYSGICKILYGFCKYTIITMVPLMAIIVILQVFMRYVFKSPFVWAEEAARYLLIWISCLGSAYATRDKLHINITFIQDRLKGTSEKLATFISHFLVIAFFAVCVLYGIMLAVSEYHQVSPGLGISMTWILLSIPVGFTIMVLFAVEIFLSDLSKVLISN